MRTLSLTAVCLVLGCGASPEEPSDRIASKAEPIASLMGGVEAAIDAPWRLEPDWSTEQVYPPIPLVFSVHDASLQVDPDTQIEIGSFCELRVRQEGVPNETIFTINTLSEVERSDKWPYSSDAAANHRLCRHWKGESCAPEQNIGGSAEWHGTARFWPQNLAPGADIHLTVQARVARTGQPCGPAAQLTENAPFEKLTDWGNGYIMTNRFTVHVGEEPLPRFDAGWVYGDLHYHSQGTDNEGESAYAYRPTLQAMRAIGLDFVFATDHASDSGQTTDIDEIYVDNIELPYVPSSIEDFLERLAASYAIGAETSVNAARDMNPQRFAAMRASLNGATGANLEVMNLIGGTRAPRIFLGGEVDVIPEMSLAERNSGLILYGNRRMYSWTGACTAVPPQLQALEEWTSASICDSVFDLAEPAQEGGRYLVKDIQGLGDQYFARQHLLHLPTDGTRDDAFVSSRTTLFGGAYRRLKDLLTTDYASEQKGYAFLAHPAAAASGSGMGRLGPDIVPYSEVQLRTAFESPSVLGLQVWNEDGRLRSGARTVSSFCFGKGFPLEPSDVTFCNKWRWSTWLGFSPTDAYAELHDGLSAWDRMLLWGIRTSQTSTLPWLLANEPRRVFMAGGSDAHGDWNYRREGSITGLAGIIDTAIGKPRNLLYVGPDRPETAYGPNGQAFGQLGQAQVTSALAGGNFSVTDGPALRIAVDRNSNGVIDAGDTLMGGVTDVTWENSSLPFIVEWKSTDEFGGVGSIDLYVGVSNDSIDAGLTYAAANHGIHSAATPAGSVSPNTYTDAAGLPHQALKDGYMLDPTGKLRIIVPVAQAKAGRKTVYLRVNDFVVGKRRKQTTEPECHDNVYCNKPGYLELCEEICTTPDSTYHFDSVSRPDRMYVRAFARTIPKGGSLCTGNSQDAIEAQLTGRCIERLAFTNPVWARNYVAGSTPPPQLPPPQTPPTSIPLGGECNGSVPCVCGTYCSGEGTCPLGSCTMSPGVCKTSRPIGATCTEPDACVSTAYCSENKLCVARPPNGSPCSLEVPCLPSSTCFAGACMAGGKGTTTCKP